MLITLETMLWLERGLNLCPPHKDSSVRSLVPTLGMQVGKPRWGRASWSIGGIVLQKGLKPFSQDSKLVHEKTNDLNGEPEL